MAASKESHPPLIKYASGAVATMGACLFSNPLEVLKTRMQLQGELQASKTYVKPYKNVFHAFYVVARTEGIRGLQAGLGLGLLYQAAMNGSRLSTYDVLREYHYTRTGRRQLSIGEEIVYAATSGAVSALFGSPFYLVKTQQQSRVRIPGVKTGYQHEHRGAVDAFRKIIQQEGVFGLWRGMTGSIPRLIVGSATQLTTYAQSKQLVQRFTGFKEGIMLHFTASMMSGVCVALAMNPFDVLTTRLYNQPVDPKTGKGVYYRSWPDALVKTAKSEGFMGFYKGVGAMYLRIGPHTVLTFVFWEQLRALIDKHYGN